MNSEEVEDSEARIRRAKVAISDLALDKAATMLRSIHMGISMLKAAEGTDRILTRIIVIRKPNM